ncbi:MAG: endonuclease/exonuclease/phosphatase family protein [Armatimonas sp.]
MTPKPGTTPAPTKRPNIKPAHVVVGGLTIFYAAFLFWLWDAIVAGPDRSWFLNGSLYLPQILWALPGLVLFVAALFTKGKGKRSWRLPVMTLLPLLIVFGPLMGLRGFPSPSQPMVKAGSKPLKVITYNVGGGRDALELVAVIKQEQPDIILIQELGGPLETQLRNWFPEWNFKSNGEFLVGTALPILSFERVELPKLADDPWKRPAYVRVVTQLPDKTEIAIFDTHLSTPRPALAAMKERKAGATADLESNSITRLNQGKQLAEALQNEKLPYILGGDFNAPEASIACQLLLQSGARNAFSEAGKGYGYTSGHALRFGMSFVRIDHIFVSKYWAVEECHAGDKSASDHRPMIATLQQAAIEN